MSINVRSKGQRAERQVIGVLQPVVNEVYMSLGCPIEQVPRLQRNTLQSDIGGFDIVGLDWIALEVKHQEKLECSKWWQQTVRQAKNGQEPILMYKQNNVRFRVMLHGQIAIHRSHAETGRRKKVRTVVDIPLDVFLLYFRERVYSELTNG